MSFLLPLLLACAPHHSSFDSYKEPKPPKNEATVVFAVEDHAGKPINLSSTYEERQADWHDSDYKWHTGAMVERSRTPTELRYITVDGRADEAGTDDPRAPRIAFETGNQTQTTSWLQISMRKGRHTVQFPPVIRIGDVKYQVEDPTREVMFTDRAIEHLVLTPLPAIVRTVAKSGMVKGHFALQKDDVEIPLDADGTIRPNPEDLGPYTLVWIPENQDHTVYPGACTNIVREASIPQAVSNRALCSDARGHLLPECTCASINDQELHLSIVDGMTVYQIMPKKSPPVLPPSTTTVVFWNQAPSHVGDTIRVWYGADIEVKVTYGIDSTLLEDDL